MAGLFEKGFGALAGYFGQRKNARAQQTARKDRMSLVDQLDWEPAYASENAPTYQKTKSPVARGYLESLLLGQNPDATWEGETNAKYKKAAQQRTTNNLYGNVAQRAAESAAVQKETPWKVTQRPTTPVRTPTIDAESERDYFSLRDARDQLKWQGVAEQDIDRTLAQMKAEYGDLGKVSDVLLAKSKSLGRKK
jgi:hypothetical protein